MFDLYVYKHTNNQKNDIKFYRNTVHTAQVVSALPYPDTPSE